MKRWILWLVVAAVLGIGGYLGYQYIRSQQQANALNNYQTTTIGRGSLTALVGATGFVRAQQSAALAWETSGMVETINVALGEKVDSEQVLAVLEQTSLAQNVILAQADLLKAQNALDDLMNSSVARVQARQAVSQTQQAVIEAERALVRFDEDEYQDDLDKARDDMANFDKELQDALDDFEPYQDWDEDNETRKSYQDKLDEAQRKYDESVRVYDSLLLEQSLAQASFDLAKANLADALREFDRLKDGPDPDDISVLEAQIAAAQATLDQSRLDAPFAGTITDVSLKPGDQVSPGKVGFRLDDLSRLFVDVRLSEVDINRVTVGQEVLLTFDAVQGKEYHGIVNEVSQVGAAVQGTVEFDVTIELTDPDEDVKPGMTAAVNIVVEKLENVLLVPNRAVRVQDGQRVVYILRDSSLQAVQLTLGASSDTMSEVVEGNLLNGDTVVLNPPLTFDTNGPPPFVQR